MLDSFYFGCRVLRKFFPERLIPRALRSFIPGLRPNLGEMDAAGMFHLYEKNMPLKAERWLQHKSILEVGVGRTNGSCYRLMARGARETVAFEPFRQLEKSQDEKQLREASNADPSANFTGCVRRVANLDAEATGGFDTVLSVAVLEHVIDMNRLAADLNRLLKPGGCMLHVVDYRDHFFRYPYHHLLWSEKTWSRWLDPGDLPRWRVGDHLRIFEEQGFRMSVIKASSQDNEFAKIANRVHPRFRNFDDFNLRTTSAIIFGTKESSG